MNDIESYYTQRVSHSKNLLYQVGKTIDGKPVNEHQLNLITQTIKHELKLSTTDTVIDFGCGNGVLTKTLTNSTKTIIGIERNKALYSQASKYLNNQKVSLVNANILHHDTKLLSFNKAYCYEVIQHLTYLETKNFLFQTVKNLPKNGLLFLGGIPDEQRKSNFYNTEYRQRTLAKTLLETGSDPVGTWFLPVFFYELADKLSATCRILDQHKDLYSAHYRFDCLIRA